MIDKQALRKLSEADEFQVKGDSHDIRGFMPDVSFVAAEPTLAELAERERPAPTDTLPDMVRGSDYDTLR